jgi:hypothetical protein
MLCNLPVLRIVESKLLKHLKYLPAKLLLGYVS